MAQVVQATGAATVEIVVPVHAEEAGFEASVRRLHAFLGVQPAAHHVA